MTDCPVASVHRRVPEYHDCAANQDFNQSIEAASRIRLEHEGSDGGYVRLWQAGRGRKREDDRWREEKNPIRQQETRPRSRRLSKQSPALIRVKAEVGRWGECDGGSHKRSAKVSLTAEGLQGDGKNITKRELIRKREYGTQCERRGQTDQRRRRVGEALEVKFGMRCWKGALGRGMSQEWKARKRSTWFSLSTLKSHKENEAQWPKGVDVEWPAQV
ncbi:hypothetical protein DL93DRAFT_2185457 [Clavulina sp. PMI_390]|nr:hypothetical protein DL93DRAFT_2185457 [Clavulina sp. PMI_390]